MKATRRLRGWIAWHSAKPWMTAIHDRAKGQVDQLENLPQTEDQHDYRLGVGVGKVSAMSYMRDAMRSGTKPNGRSMTEKQRMAACRYAKTMVGCESPATTKRIGPAGEKWSGWWDVCDHHASFLDGLPRPWERTNRA